MQNTGRILTARASMQRPSLLCSTSKPSRKWSSTCRCSSTDSVYRQSPCAGYGAGQEGLEMSPLRSPDRSSEQRTALRGRLGHCGPQHSHVSPSACPVSSSPSLPHISFCFLRFPRFRFPFRTVRCPLAARARAFVPVQARRSSFRW